MSFKKGEPNPGFKKGQSGNPSGRSAASDKLRQAFEGDVEKIIKRLWELMDDPDSAIAAKVTIWCAEKVGGKPVQEIETRIEATMLSDGNEALIEKLNHIADKLKKPAGG